MQEVHDPFVAVGPDSLVLDKPMQRDPEPLLNAFKRLLDGQTHVPGIPDQMNISGVWTNAFRSMQEIGVRR
ncbi:hypothetical protein NBRC116597_26060 [Phaeobacter sp. NW0010-22]